MCLLFTHQLTFGATAGDPVPSSEARRFAEWAADQATRTGVSADPQSLQIGLDLARARAKELRSLLEADPAEFLRQAMPAAQRDQLPIGIQPYVEQRIKGRGFFGAYCVLPPGEQEENGHAHPARGIRYEVRMGGRTYEAFVFGKWRDQTTVLDAEIEGVVLDGAIAIGDSPTPDEQGANGDPVTADAPAPGGANTVLFIIASFSDQTNSPLTDATALSRMDVVNQFYLNNSSGTVSFKGIRNPGQVMDVVQVVLPRPLSYASTYSANFSELLTDARNAAAAAGYNYANYNLDMTFTSGAGFGYAGRAWIGAQGAHVTSTALRVLGHELGHNFGLFHADYWRTDSTCPFGRDSVPGGYVGDTVRAEWVEYGHYFSLMSAQSGTDIEDPTKSHFAPAEKVRLGWLSGGEVQYVTSSGVYRLFRHDERTTTGTPRAVRIETPATDYTGSARRYWLNYRYSPWSIGVNWLRNGVQVDVCQQSYGGDGAIQLDMTPFSCDDNAGASYTDDNTDKRDGAVVVGRTYSDTTAGIHITPIATGSNGANEEYIDIAVNLGSFPANRAPVIAGFNASSTQIAANQPVDFSVSATDPDGETLAYSWDFDQVQTWTASGLNSAAATKSWPGAGQYRVVVTVSDMKGGIATASRIVTVGAPVHDGQLFGRVLWAGKPVYGARVWTTIGSTVSQAWTESNGTFALTDLPRTNTYIVNCSRAGLTFTAQFQNPVSVASADLYGTDFYANEPLPGGAGTTFAISGQVTDGGAGVAGAEVRAGGMLATTDTSGNYRLTNFIPATYTVTASKDGWTFSPSSRSVGVSTSDSTGNDFARVAPYSISGTFSGVAAGNQDPAPTVYLSNGRSLTATRQNAGGTKYWVYTLTSVPAGQYSVSAFVGGYVIRPSRFSNPLTVSGNLSGIDFAGSAGTVAGAISGRITRSGLPLAGVSVQVNQNGTTVATATSDSDGYYRADNLANGSYTLVPSLNGYTFSPSSLSLSSVPASGKNFTASGGGPAPSIASATANPSPVPSGSTVSTLSAVASGTAPLVYSWDATSAAAPVSFSANDSASASMTTVSFQAPGNYTFRVRVTDGNGLSSTRTVSLVVNAGAGSMVVGPYEVQVPRGQSVQFHADAWDQLGNRTRVTPNWAVGGGGTINATGLFSATAAGGPYTVTATSGALSAAATVWVTQGSDTIASPNLAVVNQGNGSYLIQFSGVPDVCYRIEYCDNLSSNNWQTLGSQTANSNGTFQIVDTPPVGAPTRYYRSVYP